MAKWPYNTTKWQKLRLAKLAQNPDCEACARRGRIVAANAVDHILSIAKGGHPFPQLDELAALCTSCHSRKTGAVDRAGGSGIAFPGFDADGAPLDPDHPYLTGRGRSQSRKRLSARTPPPVKNRVN